MFGCNVCRSTNQKRLRGFLKQMPSRRDRKRKVSYIYVVQFRVVYREKILAVVQTIDCYNHLFIIIFSRKDVNLNFFCKCWDHVNYVFLEFFCSSRKFLPNEWLLTIDCCCESASYLRFLPLKK